MNSVASKSSLIHKSALFSPKENNLLLNLHKRENSSVSNIHNNS